MGHVFVDLDKCHVVKFGAQAFSNRIYFRNGKASCCGKSFKYLRVTIVNDFNWDLHIDKIAAKASQRHDFMKHVLLDAPRKSEKGCISHIMQTSIGVCLLGMGSLSS